MTEKVGIRAVANSRGETIEVGYIVTVLEAEHLYGTGEILRIRGHTDDEGNPRAGGPHFALVRWEQDSVDRRFEWLGVDELTNINVAARDKALER